MLPLVVFFLIIYGEVFAWEVVEYNETDTGNGTIQAFLTTSVQTPSLDEVEKFLSLVAGNENSKNKTCQTGTGLNLGEGVVLQYGKRRFRAQAELAVNRANLLTELWKSHDQELLTVRFFFNQVINLVQSDDDMFGAGNCYNAREYKNRQLFCPYAHKEPGQGIIAKDLSIEYPYLGEEWFSTARENGERLVNGNSTSTYFFKLPELQPDGKQDHGEMANESIILVSYEDGHWSKPYFDCGGGYIWMMTYTVPFFDYQNGSFRFKGTSGIDIDLQKVDIDQCESPVNSGEMNVFANSSKCDATTKCEPVQGLGFRRGSYKCVCRDGYYFPNISLSDEERFFNGAYAEEQYALKIQRKPNFYDTMVCQPCAEGCDSCRDSSPCIIELDWILRGCLLGLSCLIMCIIPALGLFIWKYKHVKVLKAASPKLLCLILLGAFFMYCPMLVMYLDASEVTCSLKIWFRELGFSISYGALLLKTWRISVVFRVRSATRVKITDMGLVRRVGLVVGVFILFLIARMIWGRPEVTTGTHKNDLKAFQCSFNAWDYCQAAAELCLLIWGIRLCIVVRKAPSEFNESRFISWAIYNETLLSIMLNLALLFLQSLANPDLLYIVYFVHTNLTTTVTLLFLFLSKAYLVFKIQKRGAQDSKNGTTRNSTFKYAKSTNKGTADSAYTESTMDGGPNSLQWKEVEDELKRVYTELERYKQGHMMVDNPHILKPPHMRYNPKLASLQQLHRDKHVAVGCQTSPIDIETVPNEKNLVEKICCAEMIIDDARESLSITPLLYEASNDNKDTLNESLEGNLAAKSKRLVNGSKIHNMYVNIDDLTNATSV